MCVHGRNTLTYVRNTLCFLLNSLKNWEEQATFFPKVLVRCSPNIYSYRWIIKLFESCQFYNRSDKIWHCGITDNWTTVKIPDLNSNFFKSDRIKIRIEWFIYNFSFKYCFARISTNIEDIEVAFEDLESAISEEYYRRELLQWWQIIL